MIDVVHGLAAVAVAWFHLTNTYEWGWLRQSGSYGWLGVEVFFVLSGFVIPYALARLYLRYSLADFPNFLLRRFIRLEPPYILSLILVIALWELSASMPGFRGEQPDYKSPQLASHLFYLIPYTQYSWLQPVYWSLAYEFAFYIVMGLLFPLIFSPPATIKIVGAALVVVILVLFGVLTPICLLFLLGISLFCLLEDAENGGGSRLAAPCVVSLVIAAMIILDHYVILLGGLVAMLAIYVGRGLSFNHIFFRPFLWLGAISYSLYLVHVPVGGRVVNLGRRFVFGPWQEFALSLTALVISVGFAVVFWVLVERPSMRLARSLTAKAKPLPLPPGKRNEERRVT